MDFKEIDIGELGRNIFAKILKATATQGTYSDTLDECRYRGTKFTDESFPPEKKSLISDWDDPAEEIQEKVEEWDKFVWVRADEVDELNDDEGPISDLRRFYHSTGYQAGAVGRLLLFVGAQCTY